jgi:hypothetical protein
MGSHIQALSLGAWVKEPELVRMTREAESASKWALVLEVSHRELEHRVPTVNRECILQASRAVRLETLLFLTVLGTAPRYAQWMYKR